MQEQLKKKAGNRKTLILKASILISNKGSTIRATGLAADALFKALTATAPLSTDGNEQRRNEVTKETKAES